MHYWQAEPFVQVKQNKREREKTIIAGDYGKKELYQCPCGYSMQVYGDTEMALIANHAITKHPLT